MIELHVQVNGFHNGHSAPGGQAAPASAALSNDLFGLLDMDSTSSPAPHTDPQSNILSSESAAFISRLDFRIRDSFAIRS